MKVERNNHFKQVEELLLEALSAERKSTEEALKIAEKALVLSIEQGINEGIARSKMRIGRCYWINGDFDKAVDFLSQSLELATKIEHHETQAEALIGLGNVYITIEFTDQALNYYTTALKLVEEKNLDEQKSKLFNNLGTLHEDLKNYPTALDFYQKSYQLAQINADEYAIAIAYLNIGNVYLNLDKLDQAYDKFINAYQHAIDFEQTLLLAHSYYAFGQYYRKINNYECSIEQLKKGIVSAEESQDFYILVRLHIELANAYDQAQAVDAAKTHFETAFSLAKRLDSVEFMPRVHEQLALFYERTQLKDNAYIHYKAYFDSSLIVQENRRIERIKNIEFQTKLNTAIQETETYRLLSEQLRKNFKQMQVLSNIGRSMTATHDLEDIFTKISENINQLMVVDTLAIGFHNKETNSLDIDLFIENNLRQEPLSFSLDSKMSLSVYCFVNQETFRINDVKKEYKAYIKDFSSSRSELMMSAMYAPLIVEGEPIGTVTIQAKNRNMYTEMHEVLLQTLAYYLAISIKNAKHTKELAILNQKLKLLSESDGLTGIPNRRLFDETLVSMLASAKQKKSPLSMLFVDIDNFKDFNDTYGHLTGDEVIKNVAYYLDKNKPIDYFVARYGGDEFVMLLPDTKLDEAKRYAAQLTQSIHAMKHLEHVSGKITVSIGLSTILPTQTIQPEQFIKHADQQLYQSKKHGKNKVTAMHFTTE